MTTMEQMVQAVKDHAVEHYEDGGWDVIVECWGDDEITDALREAKVRSTNGAVKHFAKGVVAVWADRQADARNSAF